ncbi:hypothetical protein [Vibrio nitrifigilis]|uniref:hypothetical protein n=1 Tax=Vibrio nitrifigilis TaxID=2789781 RepID=UPI0038B4418A
MTRNEAQIALGRNVVDLLLRYSQYEVRAGQAQILSNRVKQWFTYLRKAYPEAKELFHDIRTYMEVEPIGNISSVIATV